MQLGLIDVSFRSRIFAMKNLRKACIRFTGDNKQPLIEWSIERIRPNAKRLAIFISAFSCLTLMNFASQGFLEKIVLASVLGVVAVMPFLTRRFSSWIVGSTFAAIFSVWMSFLLSGCKDKFGNGFGWQTLIVCLVSRICG